ncbi:hypothetical protein [Streptomyces sp. NPDC055006]
MMTSQPPRPDEDDLARFHNGDTLDNIPIVRLPSADPMSRRRRAFFWGSAIVSFALLGAGLGVGVVRWSGGRAPAASTHTAPEPTAKAQGAPRSTKATPSAKASVTPWAEPSPSAEIAKGSQLEQVQIIQAPATGGDPSTTYCLVYTGGGSGSTRDAILLSNVPAYQCTDLLPYDPVNGAWSTVAPDCASPSRPAVLSFTDATEWAGAVYFTCLTKHSGA